MQLDAVRTLTNGATDPDPGVASTISAGLVFATRARQPSSDVPNTVLVLALEAPSTETVTVDLYAVFEDTSPPQDVGNLPGALANSRFYLIATGVVVTGSRLLAREVFLGGQVYARVTADTMTVPRKLRATCAPGQASEAASGGTVVTTTQLPPALGQQTMANSVGVAIASNQSAIPTISGTPAKTDNTTYIVTGNMSADVVGPAITVGPEGRLLVQCAWTNTGAPIGSFVLQGLMPDASAYDDVAGADTAWLRQPNNDTNTSMAYFRELQVFTSVRVIYRRTSGGTANTSLDVNTRIV